jgi:hypothetical protein
MKAIEQFLHSGFAIQIDSRKRMSISGQEIAHAQSSRRMTGSDQHDVSELVRDQFDPAKNKMRA